MDPECVVIGAGISGLEAALTVVTERPGTRVTIFESRDRVGGRVKPLVVPAVRAWPEGATSAATGTSGASPAPAAIDARPTVGPGPATGAGDCATTEDGVVMDAGGAWIHGTTGNPLVEPYCGAGGAVIRAVHDRNVWMQPLATLPGDSASADGVEAGPLLVYCGARVSSAERRAVVEAHARVWAGVRERGLRASVAADPSIPARVSADAALALAGLCGSGDAAEQARLAKGTAAPSVRKPFADEVRPGVAAAGARWALWNSECWMGASLCQLQAAELGNTDEDWGDFPGPHGPVVGVRGEGPAAPSVTAGSGEPQPGLAVTLAGAPLSLEQACRLGLPADGPALAGTGLVVASRLRALHAAAVAGGSTVKLCLGTPVAEIRPKAAPGMGAGTGSTSDGHRELTAVPMTPGCAASASGIEVVTAAGDHGPAASDPPSPRGSVTVQAPVVLLTVPSSVLRAALMPAHGPPAEPRPRQPRPLRFCPSGLVPEWKRRAAAASHMGSYCKVAMRWPAAERWWPATAPAVWGVLRHDRVTFPPEQPEGESEEDVGGSPAASEDDGAPVTDQAGGALARGEVEAAAAAAAAAKPSSGLASRAAVSGASPHVRYIENYAAFKGPKGAAGAVLVAVLVAEEALEVAAAEAAEPGAGRRMALAAALAAVREVASAAFGIREPVPAPAGWEFVDWDNDPDAAGAYSYLRVGSDGNALDRLGEPYALEGGGRAVGTILWAGEAADAEWMGSLHAAVRAGRRAGRHAAEALAPS